MREREREHGREQRVQRRQQRVQEANRETNRDTGRDAGRDGGAGLDDDDDSLAGRRRRRRGRDRFRDRPDRPDRGPDRRPNRPDRQDRQERYDEIPVTDDDILNNMGDVALGVTTSHHYSAAHDSPLNQKFVAEFGKANNGMRPNFMAVGGYDGMRVIVKALEATKGEGGEALINAIKGQSFESPRGPIVIDAQTRDIVQDVYIRKVEKVNGQLYNVEFDKQVAVKDPAPN